MSRRQEKREKRAREQRAADLKWLLGDARGRRIVARMIGESGMDVSPMTGNSYTHYHLGRHDFVRQFANELRAVDLQAFRRMEDEAIAAHQLAESDAQSDTDDDEPGA